MTLPFAATSPSEPPVPVAAPRMQRTRGTARVAFKRVRQHTGDTTRLDRLYQSGAAKVRLPRVFSDTPQAILINTAGGLTGGDRMSVEASAGEGARATVTTQACERIYRALEGVAEVETRLSVAAGARLNWLPQETILFDGAGLSRRLEADVAPGATLLAVEAVIFGRAAHGEVMQAGSFADRWRIRRNGKLAFADNLRFDWAEAGLIGRPAVLGGAGAMATVLLVADEPERHVGPLREIFKDAGGVTAFDGKLLARITAEGGAALRRVLIPGLVELLDGAALPKIWQI